MIANSAAARLRTRLMKNSELIQRAEFDGTNGVGESREFMVSFKKGGMGFIARCDENPYANSWSVVKELSG